MTTGRINQVTLLSAFLLLSTLVKEDRIGKHSHTIHNDSVRSRARRVEVVFKTRLNQKPFPAEVKR